MMLKRLLSFAVAVLLAVAPVHAAGVPLEVNADTFTIDEAGKTATFTGNVVITRSGMTLWARTVVVTYGSGGENDIDQMTASGNVRIKTTQQEARGDRAQYDPDTQILRLMDNVTVTNAQGTLKGPLLVVNVATNVSTFSGGTSGGRVTGVFTPQ